LRAFPRREGKKTFTREGPAGFRQLRQIPPVGEPSSMAGAGTQSGLQGAPSRNHPTRGGFDVVEGTLRGGYLSRKAE
jgi:hypothetical protein